MYYNTDTLKMLHDVTLQCEPSLSNWTMLRFHIQWFVKEFFGLTNVIMK